MSPCRTPFILYRHLIRTCIEHIRFNCNTTDRTIVNPARIVDMNLTFIPAKRHTSHQVAIPTITVNNCSALLRIDKPLPEKRPKKNPLWLCSNVYINVHWSKYRSFNN